MKYDLGNLIGRGGTNATKWESYSGGNQSGLIEFIGPDLKGEGLLPMWVADMDFQTAQPIIDGLIERVRHGIFGYTFASEDYFKSITNWFFTRHNWTVEKEWIVPTPGIVPAIQFAINTFCSPGDNILVQGPVYHPFYRVIEASGCKVVSNSLVWSDGGYRMNFSDLETQASDSQLKLAILCSPHNPVGRVWTVEELKQFGEICNDNNVLVIADEIHCDLIGPVSTFVPYLKAGFNFSDRALVCTAPSKTFNLAGLHLSNVIIPNPDLRDQYLAYMKKNAVGGGLNPFSLIAAELAYTMGEDWLEQVLLYIWDNYKYLQRFIKEYLPQLVLSDLQGTYLAWVDFTLLKLSPEELELLIQKKAKLLFNQGYIFGEEGAGFQRINIACPRKVLELGLGRLKTAIDQLNGE